MLSAWPLPTGTRRQPGRWYPVHRPTPPTTPPAPRPPPDHAVTPHKQRPQGRSWHDRTQLRGGTGTTRCMLWAASPRDQLGRGLRHPSRPKTGHTASPATGGIRQRRFVPANCLCKPWAIHTRASDLPRFGTSPGDPFRAGGSGYRPTQHGYRQAPHRHCRTPVLPDLGRRAVRTVALLFRYGPVNQRRY